MTEKPSLAKRLFAKRPFKSISVTGEQGHIVLNPDGTMRYFVGFKNPKFHVDDVTAAALDDGTELVRRSTAARAGGAAVIGGVLFGPVGVLAGLGAGALAKKESGGEKYLTVETPETTYVVKVTRKHQPVAQELVTVLRAHLAAK